MRKNISVVLILVLLLVFLMPVCVFAGDGLYGKRTQTVYSVLGWDGNVKNTSVVNWLRVDGKKKQISDSPELTNIVSLHPSAKMEIEEESIKWEIPKESDPDLFYSGITEKKLPIEFDIGLTFDGEEIYPENITGKSGKLELELTFTNTLSHEEMISWTVGNETKESLETIYTPMTVVVQAVIPSDNYKRLDFENAFEMTIGNNKQLMWTMMPRPIGSINFSVTDDDLRLPEISISIMPTLPSVQIPEIDNSLFEVMGSMGDTDELLEMLENSADLDMSEAISNIENLENMFDAVGNLMGDADENTEQIGLMFSNFGDSFKQIAEGADGLVKLSEGHKMILEMIQDQLSENVGAIGASTDAIKKASEATDKVSSSLFGIQFYLEEMESSLKDLRKKTKDKSQLEIISELDTSVSKSISKLNTVKGSADIASDLMKKLSSGGIIDGVEIPALSEMSEMMDMFDETLTALISGGEIQGQELPGITTTIEGLEGISKGINLILNGGEIEGMTVPAWNTIPEQITESMDSMSVFTYGGEINGVVVPSRDETLEMIAEFKKTIEETEPMQLKMKEFSESFRKAIDEIGGAEKFSEMMGDTEEMFYIETAKLDKMREYEQEYTSFVGNTEGFESSVLFVVKMESVLEASNSESEEDVINSPNDTNPYKELNKARLYLLIIAGIIIIAAIIINWYYKKRYS